ncbi:hypothetical protein F5877DRAFT_85344 [Lentinula edodes]|nr:hypothetical protein F5877DRAFT_85344 [Lentinula edodes]
MRVSSSASPAPLSSVSLISAPWICWTDPTSALYLRTTSQATPWTRGTGNALPSMISDTHVSPPTLPRARSPLPPTPPLQRRSKEKLAPPTDVEKCSIEYNTCQLTVDEILTPTACDTSSTSSSQLECNSASNSHSLLTLSDIDAFAAHSGIAVPHSPIDPNRLSTYSGSSAVPEYITKKLDDVPVATNRVSSTRIGSVILKSSPHHDRPCVPGERLMLLLYIVYQISYKITVLLSTRPLSLCRLHLVIRQPSLQRMGLPISAPPSHRLPPPPVPVDVTDDEDVDPLRFSNSAPSSTTSFKSERDAGMVNQHYIPCSRPRECELRPVEDTVQKSCTLKKAVSHQSLSKMASFSATSVSTPPPMPEKRPRKPCSFHHPRIPPLPQMPFLHTQQLNGYSAG